MAPPASATRPVAYTPAVRAQAILELRRREKRAKSPYVAYGKMAEFMTYNGDECLLSGPAGTGKSRAAVQKIVQWCLDYPNIRVLIVRKTRESLTESGLVTLDEEVLGRDHPLVMDGPARNMRQRYLFPNGSEIIIGGMDKASKVMSTQYDAIYVQESTELTVTDWESLSSRCRNGALPVAQQLLADCNPDKPTHWLYQRYESGTLKLFETTHKDNPRYTDMKTGEFTPDGERYLRRLRKLTGVRYQRLYLGKWVASEGAVYEEWDRAIHVVPNFPIPKSWRRIRAIDFGYTNPFCCQWWAIDPDGRMYLYREIYKTQRTVADHARVIKEVERQHGEKISDTVADHDAEDRATLRAAGIFTRKGFKKIKLGIEAVKEMLRPVGPPGFERPRLMIFAQTLFEEPDQDLIDSAKPTCTLQEVDGYHFPKNEDGKVVKEEPVGIEDHGVDSLRYAVCYVRGLGRPVYDILSG